MVAAAILTNEVSDRLFGVDLVDERVDVVLIDAGRELRFETTLLALALADGAGGPRMF